jgi:NodT family efflux transporter outer membrane factor (OMF) lipoprotein
VKEVFAMSFNRKSRWTFWTVALSAAVMFLPGCAVGPNFNKPAAPNVPSYTPTPPATTSNTTSVSAGEAQQFISGADIPGEWWTVFHSQPLNDLIERSLKANPDLKAAQAALTVAHENMLAQRGAYYPQVSAGFSATRGKSSNELSPIPNAQIFEYSLYTPEVSVSFVPDVFGLNRRTVESLKAQEEQARFSLVAAHITLSSNIVNAAIEEASLQTQIAATNDLIKINTNMLDILHKQFDKGYVSKLDVAAQESQLAQVTATLPPLQKQLAQQRDLLAVLSGGFPSQDLPEKFELESLQLPQSLPVSLPSQFVEQRPDVREAEENWHSASAQIGVATANRFPSFNLTADAGSMAIIFSKIFTPGANFWDLGASVTQPIFEGGTLKHRELAAKAAYTEAAAQYQSTVQAAFQNVADTLAALQQDADALKATASAKDAAKTTLDLANKQYQAGYASYLSFLNAEQAYDQATIAVVQAQTNRYADTAALFQALGGGWWHRADLPQN